MFSVFGAGFALNRARQNSVIEEGAGPVSSQSALVREIFESLGVYTGVGPE